ncbi:hypothetical protein VCSRO127_0484 [Vibrio cholerae]|nr:hypothetical protein VCSRO127_0484 [Vibrio cholerae]
MTDQLIRHFNTVRANDIKSSSDGVRYIDSIGGCNINIHLRFSDKQYLATYCDGEIFASTRLADVKKHTSIKMLDAYNEYDKSLDIIKPLEFEATVYPEYKIRRDAKYGYALTIYRQSGNVHNAWKCDGLDAALHQMNLSLIRVGREPKVYKNTENELRLILPFRGHKAQGKVIGSYEIVALDEPYDVWVQKKKGKNTAVTVFLFIIVAIAAIIGSLK